MNNESLVIIVTIKKMFSIFFMHSRDTLVSDLTTVFQLKFCQKQSQLIAMVEAVNSGVFRVKYTDDEINQTMLLIVCSYV